jgi:hypothetical protein
MMYGVTAIITDSAGDILTTASGSAMTPAVLNPSPGG